MAQQKRKSAAKKAAETRKANAKSDRQIKSVVWFAVAIFLLCVVFIEGENLWLWLHNLMFGVFGITAYVWPFVLGIVAVVYAMDKINKSSLLKITEGVLLVLFIGAAIDIFACHNVDASIGENISFAYSQGMEFKGAGAMGAIIGAPICAAFGKTGAIVTVILLMFVLFMVLTGTTLMTVFKLFSKPAKAVSEKITDDMTKLLNL